MEDEPPPDMLDRRSLLDPLFVRRTVVRHSIDLLRRVNPQVRTDDLGHCLEYLFANYKFFLFVVVKIVFDNFCRKYIKS